MIIKQGGGACEYGDTDTRPMHNEGTPRYDGPRELAQSLTAFARMSATDATWNREGLREDSEYREPAVYGTWDLAEPPAPWK